MSRSASDVNALAARAWSKRSLANLRAERAGINEINVFPVPDGDTGSNMYATLLSAHRAVEKLEAPASLAGVLSAMAMGALRGARGNSGLILSVALQGCADALADVRVVDASGLAHALRMAATRARHAVAQPVDGTMLTVLDALADEAERQTEAGASLTNLLDALRSTARRALGETTSQLAVLSENNVVDAGALGILELLDALYVTMTGQLPPGDEEPLAPGPGEEPPMLVHGAQEFGWEIVADLTDESARAGVNAELTALGGTSLVVSDLGQASRVHVHFADAESTGRALVRMSEPRPIHRLTMETLHRPGASHDDEPGHRLVAVVRGTGLKETFALAGAEVWPMEQAAHVRRSRFVELFDQHSDGALLLVPNSWTIQQELKELLRQRPALRSSVFLVRARDHMQGLAATAVFDPGAEASELFGDMSEASSATRSAALRRVRKPGRSDARSWQAGDLVVRVKGEVKEVGGDIGAMAESMIDRLLGVGGELLTLVTGDECPPGLVTRLTARLAIESPELSVTVFEGRLETDILLAGME